MPELFVHASGAGTPVLLLHSSGLSAKQWRRLGENLAADHRVLAPDLLGYGRSPPFPPERMERFDFREDLEAVERIAAGAGAPVHVVGHSYGGLLALQLALRGRVPVASVTAYEPVAFGVLASTRDPSFEAMPDAAEFFSLSEGLEAWVRRFVDWWQGPGTWDALPDFGRAPFLAAAPKVYAEVRSLSGDATPHDAYASIEAPALLLSGTESPLPARRVCEIVARHVRAGRHEEFAGAGHMGPLTHAGEVNRRIAAHVRGA